MSDPSTPREDDEADRRRLGERLREARKYLGLKQEEVAAYLNGRTALTDIESGQRRVEAIELTRLARLYHQSVGYFTGEDEAAAGLPVDVAHLARRVADLSAEDREELAGSRSISVPALAGAADGDQLRQRGPGWHPGRGSRPCRSAPGIESSAGRERRRLRR